MSECNHWTGMAVDYDRSWMTTAMDVGVIRDGRGWVDATVHVFMYCPKCGARLMGTASSHGNSETDGKQEE